MGVYQAKRHGAPSEFWGRSCAAQLKMHNRCRNI